MIIEKRPSFSMYDTVMSHGWFQLAPFSYETAKDELKFAVESNGRVTDISVTESKSALKIAFESGNLVDESFVSDCVKHVLRLDEPFDEFYRMLDRSDGYGWIKSEGIGPMLRSPTVFEDLVKTICTTNCTWGLTKAMTYNLVDAIGSKAPTGNKAFPTPLQMAQQKEGFFKNDVKAGYRGPYLRELAESVASGQIDPEEWLTSELPTADLKKQIKKIKGVGDYAAEHLLKLLGRYDGLALDSFLRSSFYKHYNKGKTCPDKKIERKYNRFGVWKGLVIWFDMVQKESDDDD